MNWLIGALSPYGAGQRSFGPGGLVAAAVYLLLPYGINASMSARLDEFGRPIGGAASFAATDPGERAET